MKVHVLFAIGFISVMLCLSARSGQSPPQALNYQAVARDSAGYPLTGHAISVRTSILNGSATGNILYSETFNTTTNLNGLFSLQIGTGVVVRGVFSLINWTQGGKLLKVELDINGGNNYLLMDTARLLTVPYALYSANAGLAGNVTSTVSATGDTLYIGDTYYIIPGISLANACRSDLVVDTLPYTLTFPHAGDNPYNTGLYGIPRFIHHNYIELDKITSISRFRSGAGHDYSDSYESCCSMKHYFKPFSTIDWTTVKIYAPVNGTIISSTPDSIWGQQIAIMPFGMPAFMVILFHVNPTAQFSPGDTVISGTQIGTHASNQTTSDFAIRINRGSGNVQLISLFDAMTNELFSCYTLRGVMTRDTMVIPEAARLADPLLPCNGQQFFNQGTIPNWVNLQ